MSALRRLFRTVFAYFESKGNIWLVAITVIEFLFYLAYTAIYTVNRKLDDNVTENQIYKWALTMVLLLSCVYFLYTSLRNKTIMDLFAFLLMLILTNIYFFAREIVMIKSLYDNVPDTYAYYHAEIVMSWVGLFGSIFAAIFIGLLIKPLYKGMQEDVFIKIGGVSIMWEVYKYYTLCKSFIKLDLISNSLFMVTGIFFWYSTEQSWAPLLPDIFVTLLVVLNNIHGNILINNKLKDHFIYFIVFRAIIQFYFFIKLVTMEMAYSVFFAPVRHRDEPPRMEERLMYQRMVLVFMCTSAASMGACLMLMKKTMTYFGLEEFEIIKNDFSKSLFTLQAGQTEEEKSFMTTDGKN